MKIIAVEVKSNFAHFGTINSNHSTKLTYSMPTRTNLLGMFGAIMGLNYCDVIEKWDHKINFAWKWLSENETSVIMVNRHKIEKNPCYFNMIKSKNKKLLSDSPFDQTLDSIEYLKGKNGLLKGKWFIIVDEQYHNEVLKALKSPTYPICLGNSECLASIQNVEIVNGELVNDEIEADYIVSDECFENALCETMPRRVKGYREGIEFAKVWIGLSNKLKGVSKFGGYRIGDEIVAIL